MNIPANSSINYTITKTQVTFESSNIFSVEIGSVMTGTKIILFGRKGTAKVKNNNAFNIDVTITEV